MHFMFFSVASHFQYKINGYMHNKLSNTTRIITINNHLIAILLHYMQCYWFVDECALCAASVAYFIRSAFDVLSAQFVEYDRFLRFRHTYSLLILNFTIHKLYLISCCITFHVVWNTTQIHMSISFCCVH